MLKELKRQLKKCSKQVSNGFKNIWFSFIAELIVTWCKVTGVIDDVLLKVITKRGG